MGLYWVRRQLACDAASDGVFAFAMFTDTYEVLNFNYGCYEEPGSKLVFYGILLIWSRESEICVHSERSSPAAWWILDFLLLPMKCTAGPCAASCQQY